MCDVEDGHCIVRNCLKCAKKTPHKHADLIKAWADAGFGAILFMFYCATIGLVGIIFGLVVLSEHRSVDNAMTIIGDKFTNSVPYRVLHAWSNKYCFTISFK